MDRFMMGVLYVSLALMVIAAVGRLITAIYVVTHG